MVLALKPYRTQSHTEGSTKDQDCPEANTNLAPDETAEPVTEAFSHKTQVTQKAI